MAALGGVLIFVGWALCAVGGIMNLVTAFKQDVTKGLLALFVPFYILYFVFTNWEECKKGFLMSIGGVILAFGGMAMAAAGLATMAP
jgi:hypothetical protein